MSRTVNVDRMRRYRKGRVPSWARSVRGPWPGGFTALVPETIQPELKDFQRRAGITIDGILGPQSWAALDAQNTEGLR